MLNNAWSAPRSKTYSFILVSPLLSLLLCIHDDQCIFVSTQSKLNRADSTL